MVIIRQKKFSEMSKSDRDLLILGGGFIAFVILLYNILKFKDIKDRKDEEKRKENIKNFPLRETIEKSDAYKSAVEDLKKFLPKQYEDYKARYSNLQIPYNLNPPVTSLEPNDYYMMLNLMVDYETSEVSKPKDHIKKDVELFATEPYDFFSILYNIETKTWIYKYEDYDKYDRPFEKVKKYRTWGEVKKKIIEELEKNKQLWVNDYVGGEKNKGIKFFDDQINIIKNIN